MQQEYLKLLRQVQDLERNNEYTIINTNVQKTENKQAENIKIDQLETKFNQFTELMERIFLQKISMNDPIDAGKNLRQIIFLVGKQLDADNIRALEIKYEIVSIQIKRQENHKKLMGQYFKDLCKSRRQNLQEKYSNQEKSSICLICSQRIQYEMNGNRPIGNQQKEKTKKIKTYDRHDPNKFQVNNSIIRQTFNQL